MNYITPEQIKEYVNQNPTGIAGMSEDLATMVNHFAELIIQECGKVAYEETVHFPKPCDWLLDKFKRHFGVEE
jgi:hypothetical protein